MYIRREFYSQQIMVATEPALVYIVFPLVFRSQVLPQLKKRQLADNDKIYDGRRPFVFWIYKFNYYVERHQFGEGLTILFRTLYSVNLTWGRVIGLKLTLENTHCRNSNPKCPCSSGRRLLRRHFQRRPKELSLLMAEFSQDCLRQNSAHLIVGLLNCIFAYFVCNFLLWISSRNNYSFSTPRSQEVN